MTTWRRIAVATLGCLLVATQGLATSVSLFEWAFQVNGTHYDSLGSPPSALPAAFDTSQFDFTTGLGTIFLTLDPGAAGDYTVSAFFDHNIDVAQNTFFNEFGRVYGTPKVGQSWEIDEPGYTFGDIYSHVLDGTLDNTNGVPEGGNDDVSLALGWTFHLLQGESRRFRFTLGATRPTGFALAHTDPDSQVTLYYSSESEVAPVPEPASLLLIGSGALGLLGMRHRWRKPRDQKLNPTPPIRSDGSCQRC